MPARLALGRGREIRADLVCVLCARTVGRVHGPNVPAQRSMSLRVPDSGQADAVRRLRCPHCSGRLWLQNIEEVHVDRRPLSSEDLHPHRGRARRESRTG
jgi:DNA-directed RNA polymerase subunit RPC12/RpoP